MRRKNESNLLSLVRRFPGLSSADIARRSGLAPQTISVLLRGLEQQGIVIRGAVLRGRRGQPAVPILINADGGYGVGIEIGWRHIDIVLLNLRGDVLAHEHWDVDYQKADTLTGDLIGGVRKVLSVLPGEAMARVRGAGVAMPSGMHVNVHVLGASKPEAEALGRIDIAGALREELSMPVVLINDGTAACRAECTYGRGASYGDMVYIFISTYVAAGIFVDGRVIEGRSGDAANLGSSMVPDSSGEIRALHIIASIKALENRITAAGKTVKRLAPDAWDWAEFAPEAEAWIEETARSLALAIANSCAVIDFSAAIIDGILPQPMTRRLAERVRVHIGKLPITTFEPPVIAAGDAGARAPAIGAANLPIYLSIFAPETPAEFRD